MVTFISQCQKKALSRTRRVLDAFANRIGDNTWQTVITEEGLDAVKLLLRKTATKNTAVSCHWMRSRSRSELLWIVGNRRCFSAEGHVPVNKTQRSLLQSQWENEWSYLQLIKALVALAALLHDWGKATELFQRKLKLGSKQGDPLRHEWISCLLLQALVQQAGGSDEGWLQCLANGQLDEKAIQGILQKQSLKPLENLPVTAQLVGWLVLSHHRLPRSLGKNGQFDKNPANTVKPALGDLLNSISSQWGYANGSGDQDHAKRLAQCFKFPEGLLSKSKAWMKSLKRWAGRLLQLQDQIKLVMSNGAYRVVLHHARLCLMLGDHYYSSQEADKTWDTTLQLIANTDRGQHPKQKLDEHLVRVSDQGLKISQTLSRFTSDMAQAQDTKSLKRKSPAPYQWQDKAVEKIRTFKKQHEHLEDQGYGCFIVNMASTGCGKTIANAKIMRALSNDGNSLRFVLALGLRTLTLQTGDEYRERIGLDADELAVLIGSSAVQELHRIAKKESTTNTEATFEDQGSESLENLLDEDLQYDESPTADFLNVVLHHEKHKAFLYKPVLVCTIDHIIAATETLRGGKYILPSLRLLSSDLVIDEVDDFNEQDLIAIARLVHLAGMLGRKVMISSATIPPAFAEGFFHAYQAGWLLHSQFHSAHRQVACAWVDEFSCETALIPCHTAEQPKPEYGTTHQRFVKRRVEQLNKQEAKRKAYIQSCDSLRSLKNDRKVIEPAYFEIIQQTILDLHKHHHTVDKKTGKHVSFGVVRMANIPPCVALGQFLLEAHWPDPVAPRVMAYHSRQVLLLRAEQERHLDQVLKRKEALGDEPLAFSNPSIRQHLDTTSAQNVIFILVATPVEEVGRDHDFDWAVIEPSSFRSIIQMAGRVRRHREGEIVHPNIAVMQYSLNGWLKDKGTPVFCRPGYEKNSLLLTTHDVRGLLDETALNNAVNAIPRIQQPETLKPKEKLADLEHQAMINSLLNHQQQGPACLQGWLNEAWWLTGVHQQFNTFRQSAPETTLHLIWKDGDITFCEKNEQGRFFVTQEKMRGIQRAAQLSPEAQAKLWLPRSYETALRNLLDGNLGNEADVDRLMEKKSERYGEIRIPDKDGASYWYSDQFGIYPKNT